MIVTIEKLDIGYVVRVQDGLLARSRASTNIEDTLLNVLFFLEGRAPCFGGSAYGDVRVFLDEKNKPMR